jgi:hypothetical protein
MRSYAVLIVALSGPLGALSALAEDTPIDIQTDIEGQYFLVEEGGSFSKPTLVVKRVTPDATTHYIKREFDCDARSVRYLGEGESLEEMAASRLESEASPINAGSIPDQLARLVCHDE